MPLSSDPTVVGSQDLAVAASSAVRCNPPATDLAHTGKRARPGAVESASALELSQRKQKRSKLNDTGTPTGSSTQLQRSADFWYPDGNVVIKVESTYFKLLRSRLMRHCKYFAAVPDAAPADGPATIDGCPVYEVADVSLEDFKEFVRYLEIPLTYPIPDALDETVFSLLRASDILSCDSVFMLAKQRMEKLWPASPRQERRQATDILFPHYATVCMTAIQLARSYEIPGVVKSAFHDLLGNGPFCDAASGKHPKTGQFKITLRSIDLVRFHAARWELNKRWHRLLATPPQMPCEGVVHPPYCRNAPKEQKRAVWAESFQNSGLAKRDLENLAHEISQVLQRLDGLKTRKDKVWCSWCIDEHKKTWQRAQEVWWEKMDVWLHTREGLDRDEETQQEAWQSDNSDRIRIS